MAKKEQLPEDPREASLKRELKAMRRIAVEMDTLEEREQQNVLQWLGSKYDIGNEVVGIEAIRNAG